MNPPQPPGRGHVRGRREPRILQPGQHERVERVPRPRPIMNRRRGRVGDGPPAPVIRLPLLQVEHVPGRPGGDRLAGRPRGPEGDPPFQIGDRRLIELAGRGHLVAFVPHGLEQQTGRGVGRVDGRAGVPAGQQPGPVVQPQVPAEALRIGRVALVAVLDQHRPDPRLKKREVFGRHLVHRLTAEADGHRGE